MSVRTGGSQEGVNRRGGVGSTALSSAEEREMLATRFEGSWPHGQSVPTDCEDFGSMGPSTAVVELGPLSCACPRLLESYHLTTSGVGNSSDAKGVWNDMSRPNLPISAM